MGKQFEIIVFINCLSARTKISAHKWVRDYAEKTTMIIKDYFIFYNPTNDQKAEEHEITCTANNLAKKMNKKAMTCESDVFLFIDDSMINANFEELDYICREIGSKAIDACSPAVYSEKEKQFVFKGEEINKAVFTGYAIVEHMGNPTNHKIENSVPETRRNKETSLADNCFAVSPEIFNSNGGFTLNLGRFFALDLTCKLLKEKYNICCFSNVVVKIQNMPLTILDDISTDLFFLINTHKNEFGDKNIDVEEDVYREVFLPPDWSLKDNANGNVLLCGHELSRTGAPVVLLDMGRRLKGMGFNVVFCIAKNGELAKEIINEGFLLFVDKAMIAGRFLKDDITPNIPMMIDGISNYFNKILISTLVCHNLLKKFQNKPKEVLFWIHEGQATLDFAYESMPHVYSDNIKVFCVGKYSETVMHNAGLFLSSEILLYGVEDYFALKNRTVKKINIKDKIKFALIGTYEERKGHQVFIDAILTLSSEYLKKIEFYILGFHYDPAITAFVGDFCSVWPNAHEVGAMSRNDLFDFYSDIDVIVSPSLDDPMPVVLTEGMMFNKICITSTNSGTAYYIRDGENGYVSEAGNPKDLARCIKEIVDNVNYATDMQKKSRKIYDENFSMEIFDANLRKYFK